MKKQHLRIQEGHFLKIALNLDLTLSDDGKCLALLKSSGIIDLGAFCVELRPSYCKKRVSVPMSYIPCLVYYSMNNDDDGANDIHVKNVYLVSRYVHAYYTASTDP